MGGDKIGMDFTNRTAAQPPQNAHQPVQQPLNKRPNNKKRGYHFWPMTIMGGLVVLLVVLVLLAVSLSKPATQSSYVQSNRLQAVFLNTGQVYFGNIDKITPQYFVLTNIYYLQTNNGSSSSSSSSSSSNTSVSLVKLGCELHAPEDQMVINAQQVTFWENLNTTGQVAKAVQQYQKQYPNGQVCSNQSSSANSATSQIQNAAGSSSSTSTSPSASSTTPSTTVKR